MIVKSSFEALVWRAGHHCGSSIIGWLGRLPTLIVTKLQLPSWHCYLLCCLNLCTIGCENMINTWNKLPILTSTNCSMKIDHRSLYLHQIIIYKTSVYSWHTFLHKIILRCMSLFITLTGSGILRIFVANYEISENCGLVVSDFLEAWVNIIIISA